MSWHNGPETWTIRKEDIKRLQVFEMWISRRMEKICWIEHIHVGLTNEQVLAGFGKSHDSHCTIRKR